ncbi:nuclear pore complex subunit Nro1-domain-containing protein [Cladochytrium replicatum]|nr:nuclear pore complex subunit Nro1-domain-containing protein [Cladochytrium replicatum]
MDRTRKKPRGIRKAHEESKAAENEEVENAGDEDNEAGEPTTVEIAFEESGKSSDPDVAEIEALFETAKAKMKTGDDETAILLLRGAVHECDKLLRKRNGEGDEQPTEKSSEDVPSIPPEFHLVYGQALYELGMLEGSYEDHQAGKKRKSKDSKAAFFDAAIERLKVGLEVSASSQDEQPVTEKLRMALAVAFLSKATFGLRLGKSEKSVESSVDEATNWFGPGERSESDRIVFADLLQRHADLSTNSKYRIKWNGAAENIFKTVLEDGNASVVDALVGIGSCKLSLANMLFEEAEDKEKDVDEKRATEYIDSALEYFTKAKAQVEGFDARLLCLIGETLVLRGNLEEEKSEDMYKEAVKCFKEVLHTEADALPTQFLEFIKSLEQPDDEE